MSSRFLILVLVAMLFGCSGQSGREQPLGGYTLTPLQFAGKVLVAKPSQVEGTLLLATAPDVKTTALHMYSYRVEGAALIQGPRWPKHSKVLVAEDSIVYNEHSGQAKKMLFLTRGKPDRKYNLVDLNVNPYWTNLVFGDAIIGYKFQPNTGELKLCRIAGEKVDFTNLSGIHCVLLGFTKGGLTLRYVHVDGKCTQLNTVTGEPEPFAWDPRILAEIAGLPPGRGAFTDHFAAYRSAQTLDHFLHVVDAQRTQGLKLIDPYTQDARGRKISEAQGNYYVDHPEALAEIGKGLGPAVLASGTQVVPLSTTEMVLLDNNYNRIVRLAANP